MCETQYQLDDFENDYDQAFHKWTKEQVKEFEEKYNIKINPGYHPI